LRRASVLLPKVSKFRNDLVRYANMLGNEHDRGESDQLRGQLNVMYGDLLPDLEELDVARQWQQFGRAFPIFETALHPPTERHDGVTFDALRFAVASLEPVIGRLQRMADEGAPVHRTFWIAAFVLAFLAGWLLRHYQDRLILMRRLPAVATWGNTKVLLIALAVAGGGITGNLFAGLVQADGWGRALRRHPVQFFIYFVLTVALAVFAGFAALSGSASG
jgi:hypothetical protein